MAAWESEKRKTIGIAEANMDFDSIETSGETRFKMQRRGPSGHLRDLSARVATGPRNYFSQRTRQKWEDQLDELIHYGKSENLINPSNEKKREKLENEKRKETLLAMLHSARGQERDNILRELSRHDLGRYEGMASLAEVPKTNKPKIFGWQGPCEKESADIQGFVVKSFTEEKKFLKQKIVPIKQDDPKGCQDYGVPISELNTPDQDSYWLTVATLSVNGMESAASEIHISVPNKPKELSIKEIEE